MRPYQICRRCIMDTSDPRIQFSALGWCSYCENFETRIRPEWTRDVAEGKKIDDLAADIKRTTNKRGFDCIIGISGGLDSSYTAYVAKEVMGLRPLLYHVDAGWNTDQAVGNIERLVSGLGLDLFTEVINWEEMRDLQVAFFRSQTPDLDFPQDAAFFSALYRFARKEGIKYVVTGANYSTEYCREPEEWGAYPGIDTRLIRDIHRRFGTVPLNTFPLEDVFKYRVWYQKVLGMKVAKPLNLVPYVKAEAERLLYEKFGWEKFQHKHHESRFTRFFEDYWLPRKFGFQKRRAHFSSLIGTGQMDRGAALDRISRPELSDDFWMHEFEYVANKLELSVEELRAIFEGPNMTFRDYKNKHALIGIASVVAQAIGAEKRRF